MLKNGVRHLGVWLCICLLPAVLPRARAAPVMAVDYGSEALKVSVVKAGRPPINIVINELSKRRTSAEVHLQLRLLQQNCACRSSCTTMELDA